MAFEDFKKKDSVTIVYTGEGKGKTSAALGLLIRALGTGWRVTFVQFIKHWDVGEHRFFDDIAELYGDSFTFAKYGQGFYEAGDLSAAGVSDDQHKTAATAAYEAALNAVRSDENDLVICDEINNAVHDKLLSKKQLQVLLETEKGKTSLCLTGRNFPEELLENVDIATNMTKLKHHFDEKYIANKGIDY